MYEDLRRLLTSPTLFRLDSVLSPRIVPVLYLVGLAGIGLWAIRHLFATFGSNFGDGLWGLLEIGVFGLLWIVVLRIACEALLVFFRANEGAVESVSRLRLPSSSLVDDVRDAIHDLAEDEYPDDDFITPATDPAPHVAKPAERRETSVRGPVVKRTAKRTPPASKGTR